MAQQQSKMNNYLKHLVSEIVKVNAKIDCCANWLLEYTKKDKSLLELITSFPKCVVIPPPGEGENGDAVSGEDGSSISGAGIFDKAQVEVVDLEDEDSGSSYFEDEEPRDCDEYDKASYSGSESEFPEAGVLEEKEDVQPDSDEKEDVKPDPDNKKYVKPLLEVKVESLELLKIDVISISTTSDVIKKEVSDNSGEKNIYEVEKTESGPKNGDFVQTESTSKLLALMKPCSVKLVKVNMPENDDIQSGTSSDKTNSKTSNKKKKNTKATVSKTKFKCTTCNTLFVNKRDLIQHHRVHLHTGKKTFRCIVCRKTFTRKFGLNTHLLIHTGEKPFECSVCTKHFRTKFDLDRHFRIHTGEKPVECSVCKHRFRTKSDLGRHFLIHTGERPFQCNVCQIRFRGKSALNKHFLIHTGEKPFRCIVCQNTFRQKSVLDNHFLIHTGEKPIRCETCGKRFRQRSSLSYHQKRNCT